MAFLRAKGDAKTTMYTMMMGAIMNAILDPLLIFGLGPIPALGLEGAAIATVISRAITMFYAGWVLIHREQMLVMSIPKRSELPRLLESTSTGWRASHCDQCLGANRDCTADHDCCFHGSTAVAAYGIGARVEGLVLIPVLALSAGLSPFIGQNWGAQLEKRVSKGFELSIKFSALWGLFACGFLFATAPFIAALFSDEPSVQKDISIYLKRRAHRLRSLWCNDDGQLHIQRHRPCYPLYGSICPKEHCFCSTIRRLRLCPKLRTAWRFCRISDGLSAITRDWSTLDDQSA